MSVEVDQRWTVSNLSTSIEAARMGYGFAWYPEEKIREELATGALEPLPLSEGGERFVELYLILPDRDAAGTGNAAARRDHPPGRRRGLHALRGSEGGAG